MATREIFFDAEECVLIPTDCPKCAAEGEQRMCVMDIPSFKEIIMMAFRCAECGFENNELKPTDVSDKGKRYTLQVKTPRDLERDIFQSYTGTISIDEVGLEWTGGPAANKFTTLLQILSGMIQDLRSQMAAVDKLPEFIVLASGLLTEAGMPFTLVLSDPAGNSYIACLENDPNTNLTIEEFDRSPQEEARL